MEGEGSSTPQRTRAREREVGRGRVRHLGKVALGFLDNYFNVLIYAVNPASPMRLAGKRDGRGGLRVGIAFAATEID